MSDKKEVIKPPIGLMPKYFHERVVKVKRLEEVQAAIARYYDADLEIKIEWIEEYNELIQYFKENKI